MPSFASILYRLYHSTTSFRRNLVSGFFLVFVTVILVFFFISHRTMTKPSGWQRKAVISPRGMTVQNIRSAARGELLAVVYEGIVQGAQSVYISLSFNGGATYLSPVKISDIHSAIGANPWIAISSKGEMIVMWHNLEPGGTATRIYYSTSTDYGAAWSDAQALKLGFDMEILPRVFYDSRDRLHLFFHAYKDGAFNLFHSEKNKEGKYHITNLLVRMTENMKGAFFPSIAFSGMNIYMTWQGKVTKAAGLSDDLFFMSSSNYGLNWTSASLITRTKANDSTPAMISVKGKLYIAYQNNDQGNWKINLISSKNNGRKWSVPMVLSTTNADAYKPALAPVGKNLLITWYDGRDRKMNVYSRKVELSTGKLKDEQRLSAGGDSRNPLPAFTGRKGVVMWEENGRIAVKASDVYTAPPVVYCRSHKRGKWSRKNTAEVFWKEPEDDSGIVGYAAIANGFPDFNPAIQNKTPNSTSEVLHDLDDGITWFHIRAIDGAGNFSRTVHYPIQVSRNPLPLPVVVSPTHPEGKSVKETTALFRWTQEGLVRLKGFLFSLTKDKITSPKTFTRSFEQSFSNLEEGNYFFSIAALDKTNNVSARSDYHIVVGTAEKIDVLKVDVSPEERGRKRKKYIPGVEIVLPVQTGEIWTGRRLSGFLKPVHIDRGAVTGYAVAVTREEEPLVFRMNRESQALELEKLTNGPWVITAACCYRDRRGKEKWTEPARVSFKVRLAPPVSPVLLLFESIINAESQRWEVVMLFILSVLASMVLVPWRRKILFYLMMMRYRMKNFIPEKE